MAVNVTTSTSAVATRGGRLTAVTSAGVDWVASYSLANTRWEFWYSSDDGATWAEATSLRITGITAPSSGAMVISENDWLWFGYTWSGTQTRLRVAQSAVTSTSTWSHTAAASGSGSGLGLDMCVARNGEYRTACILSVDATGVRLDQFRCNGASVPSLVSGGAYLNNTLGASQAVAIDWDHTGDGKSGAATAIYTASRKTAGGGVVSTVFRRLTGSAGLYNTGGPFRTIDAAGAAATDPLTGVFDGSRFVMAFVDDDSDTTIKWYERDAADTTTTVRTPTALADGAITSLSVGVAAANKNARLYAVGTTSDDVKRLTYDRAAGTFDTWFTVEASEATAETVTVQRGYQGDGHNVLWTSGAGSPYNVTFERDSYNLAPTAATWQNPPNNSAQNVAGTLPLDWAFNDPNDGDTQSAYVLERVVNGGTAEFYNAGTTSWAGTETVNSSATTSVTLPAAWAIDGDMIDYRVKTYDAAAFEGVFSSALMVMGSARVDPVLTLPADAGTIDTSKVTAAWTAAEQIAYRVRILSTADVQLFTTGKITSGTQTVEVPFTLTNSTSYKVQVATWNNDDLESSTDTHTFNVAFVEPATPTLTVTADNTNAYIQVEIADPAPTGSQPTVTSHDVFVRVNSAGVQDGERPAGGDGIRIATGVTAGDYFDRAAASGIDYEYRTLAHADNGTSTYSAWT